MGNGLRRFLASLLLVYLHTIGCDHHPETSVPCAFVPKESETYPYPEMTQFENCGRLTEGGIILDPKYLRALYFDADGPGYVMTGDRVFYLLPSGRSRETVIYDSGPDYFVEGLARGISGGKIGFINQALEFKIAPAYDFAFPFDRGYAVVCNGCVKVTRGEHQVLEGGLWGAIDRSGQIVIPLEYSKDGLKDSPAYWAHANGDPFELCPTIPQAVSPEAKCLQAIENAERSDDSELVAQLLENLAQVYEQQRRYEESIAVLRRSVKLTETEAGYNARTMLVELLDEAGELEEARDILESLNALDVGSSRARVRRRGYVRLRLARICVKLKKPDLAEYFYKKSIEDLAQGPGEDPTSPAVAALTEFYLSEGRVDAAIQTCRSHKESLGIASTVAAEWCEEWCRPAEKTSGGEPPAPR